MNSLLLLVIALGFQALLVDTRAWKHQFAQTPESQSINPALNSSSWLPEHPKPPLPSNQAVRSRAAPGWWLGLGAHVAATTAVCTLPAPRAVPAGGLRIQKGTNIPECRAA